MLATVSQVRASSGTPLGILVGVTELQELQTLLADLTALNSASEALYVTQAGTLVGTDRYTNQISPAGFSGTQQLLIKNALDRAMNKADGVPETVQFTDDSGAAAFGQVAWLDSIHTGILYEIHQQAIFGSLNSLVPFTLALFVISIGATAMLLAFGASRVFSPLAKLAEITRRFADGDFSQRAEFKSKDEIGMLAQSFNQMAEELSDLYRSLEEKVDERTRQIHTAAEVAQRITSTVNLDELLNRTVQLIVDQFSFYQASIFMLDPRGDTRYCRPPTAPPRRKCSHAVTVWKWAPHPSSDG